MNIFFRRKITWVKGIFMAQDKYCKLLPETVVLLGTPTSSVWAHPCQYTCQHQVILFKTIVAILMGEKWYVCPPNLDLLPQQTQDVIIFSSLKAGNPCLFILFLFLSKDMWGMIYEVITVRSYRTITNTSDLTQI